MLLRVIAVVTLCWLHNANCQFGPNKQSFGYVDVREGAHMFYWLFYTTAAAAAAERPLVVWLQGGPGGSSTEYGNFALIGPLDMRLQPRNYTWVNDFNVLFLDNPVGTGFSYVDDLSYLTTDNQQIGDDFVAFMRGFYLKHPEFESVPLYIYGQSYGGKMAVDMALKMKEAEAAGTIKSNLRGIGMGNAWIHPIDLTNAWAPLLLATGLVDQAGHDLIMEEAKKTEQLYKEGKFKESTAQWSETQFVLRSSTGPLDIYNILTKEPRFGIGNGETDPEELMNTQVKPALGIPDHVVFGSQAGDVFEYLETDYMNPVTDGIERLLNETDIIVTKYNGNMDQICGTAGQMLWVERLQWPGAAQFQAAPREPVWVNDRLEGYVQSHGNFRFFYMNVAGHSVPKDSPEGMTAILRDMTSFGSIKKDLI
ncbi:hypothetical protein JYU34_009058 [Plutella xylostella]|uniref:Carboxypeptidase n=1 Tax=Plutella xylostella TaxID=51655 RepID=A0ABQ7QMR4_PLUXY|nr:hypothetical protein JYU34_009058 [Plutella xylostella]